MRALAVLLVDFRISTPYASGSLGILHWRRDSIDESKSYSKSVRVR